MSSNTNYNLANDLVRLSNTVESIKNNARKCGSVSDREDSLGSRYKCYKYNGVVIEERSQPYIRQTETKVYLEGDTSETEFEYSTPDDNNYYKTEAYAFRCKGVYSMSYNEGKNDRFNSYSYSDVRLYDEGESPLYDEKGRRIRNEPTGNIKNILSFGRSYVSSAYKKWYNKGFEFLDAVERASMLAPSINTPSGNGVQVQGNTVTMTMDQLKELVNYIMQNKGANSRDLKLYDVTKRMITRSEKARELKNMKSLGKSNLREVG